MDWVVHLNSIILLTIALTNLATAYLVYHTKTQVDKVVTQTNHLTHELVRVTGKEAFAAGVKQEKDASASS